jgi:hypothetical protein
MTEWIGVDFDGTLAEYTDWSGWNVFADNFGGSVSTEIKKVY